MRLLGYRRPRLAMLRCDAGLSLRSRRPSTIETCTEKPAKKAAASRVSDLMIQTGNLAQWARCFPVAHSASIPSFDIHLHPFSNLSLFRWLPGLLSSAFSPKVWSLLARLRTLQPFSPMLLGVSFGPPQRPLFVPRLLAFFHRDPVRRFSRVLVEALQLQERL